MNLGAALRDPLPHKAIVEGVGQSLDHGQVQLGQGPRLSGQWLLVGFRFLGVGWLSLVPYHMGLSIGQLTTQQLPSSR